MSIKCPICNALVLHIQARCDLVVDDRDYLHFGQNCDDLIEYLECSQCRKTWRKVSEYAEAVRVSKETENEDN